ncbi:vWA domain-containing protein [Candidatus Nanohalobium constans]|uniref:Aerotolerance regulator N-terminal domain-containing protein n=1 Tax=Candidatus Nanohalobium constans TaxID=2565781 RepID=A0A5Q0UGD5_9ARCH|nr:BatA and WFA domain-containing protein [Candidatus Nanohalobium constans]QGA80270.1 hypothetical protein LC1Nh_0369 [Candidatus Nanohalobium constans]
MIPEILQQNFLHPVGLAALLGLIPLIIFYLVRPKPEREVMPSMTFFSEEKQKGRIRNALQKLKRNKLLILHILFVVLAAVAIANPLIQGLETDGESVIILDTSASMNDNTQEAKDFAFKHLGSQNTVIAAGSEPRVLVRDASPEAARKAIRSQGNTASSTDLISAVQIASNYNGKMVLASDMAHTETGSLESSLSDISESKAVKTMDLDHENSHGFTDLSFKNGKAHITVQNFLNRDRTVEIRREDSQQVKQVDLPALSTQTVELDLEPGRHELILPSDELAIDNKLYVSIPDREGIRVKRLGEESRYFREAMNLINQTEYSAGDSFDGAQIYFVEDGFELGQQRLKNLENQLDQGSAVILEERSELPGFAPVVNSSRSSTRQVQLQTSSITSGFTSAVTGYDIEGRSLSQPEEALVMSKDGKVLLYNVEDEVFGQQITYPIFWKNTLLNMSDRSTAPELNIKTESQVNFGTPVSHQGQEKPKRHKVQETGYYNGQKTFAANLLNPTESQPQINQIAERPGIDSNPGTDPAGKYLGSLLAVIATLELLYLSKGGAI